MFDEKGRFVIKDYNRKDTFASFLPGISGTHGIPVWSFYVNRGQGIASFGTENKNQSIMEFYPAHQSYQLTKTMGFRTFLLVDGVFYEPFLGKDERADLYIGMNELELEEKNEALGILVKVRYFTLPGEGVGGLVRKVTVKNLDEVKKKVEFLDGMPSVIPYGIELSDLKEMAQTIKAWMQVEDSQLGLPFYRVRFSTKDRAQVSRVEEGNFMVSVWGEGKRLPIAVDPDVIFGYDTSLERPIGFLEGGVANICLKKQVTQNKVPCGFAWGEEKLSKGGGITISTVIGKAQTKEIFHDFAKKLENPLYMEETYREAQTLVTKLCRVIRTKTANPVFDAYCEQTYLDNVLRGGYPLLLGKNKVFYVYSRKHGDLERDYNFFSMLPEYYSQGNGNFRDVNQNRRSDVLFAPYVGSHNIRAFYDLIQLDGYNPLFVKQVTFFLKDRKPLVSLVEEGDKKRVEEFFSSEFSPGSLLAFLEKEGIGLEGSREEFVEAALELSRERQHADFGEGYWTDHWTYNLDLVETFLSVFPEQEEELLYDRREYRYYESRAVVKPRIRRYVRTDEGVRQYDALDEDIKKDTVNGFVRTGYGTGEIYRGSLLSKLLLIGVNKMAALDFYGMGIEMEGGKPGWYDALNGLPGLFGSSVAESLELIRLIRFILRAQGKYGRSVSLPKELYAYFSGLGEALMSYRDQGMTRLWVWNRFNGCKETYRSITAFGLDGEEVTLSEGELNTALNFWIQYLEEGIAMARERTKGLIPTYFMYRFQDFDCRGEDIIPKDLEVVDMPLFLEGFVKYLKLEGKNEEKQTLHRQVQSTALYDTALEMYKVNAPLTNAPFEIGRAKAFSSGWLENESIWLHMEYKYLLELLKSGLYEEFNLAFKKAGVPFLEESTYGRSPLENVSFIVSSANEDTSLHGRGFVARLSGSTAEFLQIWQIMMFGPTPFQMKEGSLICRLQPSIPEYLIPESREVLGTFLGEIEVVYHLPGKGAVHPGNSQVRTYRLETKTGETISVTGNALDGELAKRVRGGEIKRMEVTVENRLSP